MTRKLLVFLFPLLLLVFVSSVGAENTTTGSAKTEIESTALRIKPPIRTLGDDKRTTSSRGEDNLKTLIQTKKDEFKLRLQVIKDKNKQALITRIDSRIAEVNKNQTAKFTQTLNRLQVFIDKAGNSASATTMPADLAAAQTAVDTAQKAVADQATKIYTMTITDDTALKTNAGITVSQFRSDLLAVYKLVLDAKQAALKLFIDRELLRNEASSSAKL